MMDELDYLTEMRFKSSRTKAMEVFESLQDQYPNEVEKADLEDRTLQMKERTQRRCYRQILLSLVAMALGVWCGPMFSFFYFLIFMGILVGISSFFGIQSNRVSNQQKEYLKN